MTDREKYEIGEKAFEHSTLLGGMTFTNGKRVMDCAVVEISKQIRIYYDVNPDKDNGFKFEVVEWCANHSEKEMWGETTEVKHLFEGECLYDGIRHMYCNKGEDLGYIHCGDMEAISKVFVQLHRLVLSTCNKNSL